MANGQDNGIFSVTKLPVLIRAVFLLGLASLVWSVAVPGFVALQDKVFFDDGVVSKLRPNARKEYDDYVQKTKFLEDLQNQLLTKLRSALTLDKSTEELRVLMDVERQVSAVKESLSPPISPVGFISDDISIAFFFFFFFLGVLFFLNFQYRAGVKFRDTCILGIAAYAGFEWTNWVRNAFLRKHFPIGLNHGRTVFAWPHWDIDKVSFVLQEVRVVSMFLLLAVLWQTWIAAYKESAESTEDWPTSLNIGGFGDRAALLNERFGIWQCRSVLLAGAFIPWSLFYWRAVSDRGDTRYIMAGILLHLVWATTWVILSMPLLQVWRQWSRYRLRVLSAVSSAEADDSQADRTIKIFLEAAPVGWLKIFGAGSAVVSSLLIPLIHLLFR